MVRDPLSRIRFFICACLLFVRRGRLGDLVCLGDGGDGGRAFAPWRPPCLLRLGPGRAGTRPAGGASTATPTPWTRAPAARNATAQTTARRRCSPTRSPRRASCTSTTEPRYE